MSCLSGRIVGLRSAILGQQRLRTGKRRGLFAIEVGQISLQYAGEKAAAIGLELFALPIKAKQCLHVNRDGSRKVWIGVPWSAHVISPFCSKFSWLEGVSFNEGAGGLRS